MNYERGREYSNRFIAFTMIVTRVGVADKDLPLNSLVVSQKIEPNFAKKNFKQY